MADKKTRKTFCVIVCILSTIALVKNQEILLRAANNELIYLINGSNVHVVPFNFLYAQEC